MEEKRKYLEYFDGAFDSTVVDKATFKNYPYVAYSEEENSVLFTEQPVYAVRQLMPAKIPQLKYREVDLGLPSGIKWADRNVGAKSPESRGAAFTWGAVEGALYSDVMKISIYDLMPDQTYEELVEADNALLEELGTRNIANVMTITDASYDLYNYKWAKLTTNADGQAVYKLIKYCESADVGLDGFVDNKLTLDPEDDAATIHMGNGWRTPTTQEARELIDNTDVIFVDQNGDEYWHPSNTGENTQNLPECNGDESILLAGAKLISKINGNHIYCPCTSTILGGAFLEGSYAFVTYWTSELIPLSVSQLFGHGVFQDNSPSALAYHFTPISIPISSPSVDANYNRYYPLPVRGVKN